MNASAPVKGRRFVGGAAVLTTHAYTLVQTGVTSRDDGIAKFPGLGPNFSL